MDEKDEKDEKEEVRGLDEAEDTPVDLKCNDGVTVRCMKSSAVLSDLIKSTLEGDTEATEVQLYHIDSPVVKKVIEYMDYHRKVPPREIASPLRSSHMKDIVDAFDATYVETLDQTTLFKLLLAANYLAVKSLVTLLCAKIASMMLDKNPEQIRKTFGVRPFTAEEREEVRKNFPDLVES